MVNTRHFSLCGAALVSLLTSLGCSRQELSPKDQPPSGSSVVTRYDGLSAGDVIGRMVQVYRNATSYMDNAEYQEVFAQATKGVIEKAPPHITSVVFVHPNRVRITRFVPAIDNAPQLSIVVSDGVRLVAELSDLEPQVLDVAAPEKLTPVNITPDPLLAATLLPVPMENLYPQLSLLLATQADSPWPLAAKEELEMLPPATIDREGKSTLDCFRVRVASRLGTYVYWIDRSTFLLHRLQLPSEEVRKLNYPHLDLGSYQLVIEFLDAAINVEVPHDAFQIDLPEEAIRVEVLQESRPAVGTTATNGHLLGPPQNIE